MKGSVVRLRAVLLGMALGLGLCVLAPYNNGYLGNAPLGGSHFPMAPFFIAVWLFAFSAFAAWARKRPAPLSGVELLVVWVLMVLCTGIGYGGLVESLLVNLTAPLRFAKDGYAWTEAVRPFLPHAWFPQDAEAVRTLYNGLAGGRNMSWPEVLRSLPWSAWVLPLATWAVFILLAYGLMLCATNLFSRQWVVNERVNFPLLRVPTVMAEALDQQKAAAFWTNKYLLWGIFLAAGLHAVKGWSFYNPAVPDIPTLVLAGPYFPKYGLFSGFHKLTIYIFPAFIGFAFLTTRQISFSMWFFHFLAMLFFGILAVTGLQVPESSLGVLLGQDIFLPEEAQLLGSWLVFFLFLLFLARRHIRDAVVCAVRPVCLAAGWMSEEGEISEISEQTAPAPWSLWGSLAALGGMMLWCWWYGLSLGASVLLPLSFFLVMLVAARIICQGGLAYFVLSPGPTDGLLAGFGSGFFGRGGIAAAAVMQKVLFLDLRESVMPTLMHGSKVGEQVVNRRMLPWAFAATLVLAVVAAFASMLAVGYRFGLRDLKLDTATTTVLAMYENAGRLVQAPVDPNNWVITFAVVGAGVMLLLVLMYYRFPWWPLHPLGYLLAYGSTMKILWFSFFVGWLCNNLCLRYGGTSLFNRLRFLFIGLVVGEFLMGGVFAVLGLITGQSYHVFPL